MAIDPPQAKAFEPDEKVPPITASHTLRMSDQKSGGSGAYQRYPVLAPTRVSVIDVDIDRDRGDASARSHVRETRPSESGSMWSLWTSLLYWSGSANPLNMKPAYWGRRTWTWIPTSR